MDFDKSDNKEDKISEKKSIIIEHSLTVLKTLGIDTSPIIIDDEFDADKIKITCDIEELGQLFKNVIVTTNHRMLYLDDNDLDMEVKYGCQSFMTH